jgi:peptidoglycan hydrolase-like protein with peptidoglycan-binding domain
MKLKLLGWVVLSAAALALPLGGCKDTKTRAREAEESMRAQMKDPMAEALAQKLPPATVQEAQRHLRRLHEYLGEENGVLDSVTVNAIQAFQDSQGLKANGVLTEQTMQKLREAAEKKQG